MVAHLVPIIKVPQAEVVRAKKGLTTTTITDTVAMEY